MMTTQEWARFLATLSCVGAACLTACGSDSQSSNPSDPTGAASGGEGSDGTPSIPAEPPKPTTSQDACIISADCPAGTHCDLGQCLQDCNSKDACSKGLACSVRARCIEPDAQDEDPAPVVEHTGTVTAEASSLELDERDSELEVKLEADTDDLVGYRIEVKAPFLALEGEERGEFAGSARLKFAVDPSGITGSRATGVVIVHTTLGDVAVNPSLRVGLTGRYQGLMRYSAG